MRARLLFLPSQRLFRDSKWTRKMYAAVALFVLTCLTATTNAEHHQPCHSPNMTGFMCVMTMKGDFKAFASFTYDSMCKKLRIRSNESSFTNTTHTHLDLLFFFEEGLFYEIDSKNQSCQKKALQCSLHPFDIPDDAKFLSAINVGNPSIEGEGLKMNLWTGSLPHVKGHYSMSSTMGCLPLSTFYILESTTLFSSILEVENEIKDPDLLAVPSFCQGQSLEETPEGTVHSFFDEFI